MRTLAILLIACGGATPAETSESSSESASEAEAEVEVEVEVEAEAEAEAEGEAEGGAQGEGGSFFVQQCLVDDADACTEAGHRDPSRREVFYQRALELRLAACEACPDDEGCDPVACVEAGDALVHGVRAGRDEAAGRARWEQALPWLRDRCRSHDDDYLRGRACLGLAALALHGVGGQRADYDRLARRSHGPLQRACRAGDVLACAAWGSVHWNGQGRARNEARASEIWREAETLATEQCDAGNERACTYLARKRAARESYEAL